MGVSFVTEVWPDTASDKSSDSSGATRQWLVFFDSVDSRPVDAEQAAGIPKLGQILPGDIFRNASQISCRMEGPSVARVTVQYKGQNLLDEDGNQTSPLDAPPQIEVAWISEDVEIDDDIHGKPIQNVNGESYDPPLSESWPMRQITVTRNVRDFDIEATGAYEGATNSDPFMGAIAGQVLCNGLRASIVYEPGLTYWTVSGVFTFRLWKAPDGKQYGWSRRLLNKGFLRRLKVDGDPVKDTKTNEWKTEHIPDANGQPITRPVNLDAEGDQLQKGADAVYLYWVTKPSVALGGLGLLS